LLEERVVDREVLNLVIKEAVAVLVDSDISLVVL
jgi:hypothetical protein